MSQKIGGKQYYTLTDIKRIFKVGSTETVKMLLKALHVDMSNSFEYANGRMMFISKDAVDAITQEQIIRIKKKNRDRANATGSSNLLASQKLIGQPKNAPTILVHLERIEEKIDVLLEAFSVKVAPKSNTNDDEQPTSNT